MLETRRQWQFRLFQEAGQMIPDKAKLSENEFALFTNQTCLPKSNYGRVENWTYLSPFMRYNVFICTFYCKCSFCLKDSRLVNFLRRCGASFPKLNQPKEIFSLMTLSVNILLCWHFGGQVLGLDHFMIPCTVCVQVHNWRNINNLLSLVWYQPHSKQISLLLYKPANTCL